MPSALRAVFETDLEALRDRELAPVEVAVLDSGIDSTHPDLATRVAAGYVVDLVDGGPEIRERSLTENPDPLGHGTGVASIIAAIAPNARLVDYRVLGAANIGAGSAVLAALREAVARRCAVVNLSLAVTAEFAPRLLTLVERAYHQGQVVVAARRNMPLADLGYPAEFSATVSVEADQFATPFKLRYNVDSTIEYVGRGEEVTVAATGGGYTTKTGTSFATPAIAGLCALLLGAFPELRPFEVKAALKAFADV
jgi:subtilisin family serine protease